MSAEKPAEEGLRHVACAEEADGFHRRSLSELPHGSHASDVNGIITIERFASINERSRKPRCVSRLAPCKQRRSPLPQFDTRAHRPAQRCDTVGAHVCAGRATLRHGRCARVRRGRNIATRWVRTCAPAAQRCDTVGAHVCAGRATLRHGRCARVRRPRNTATRWVRTCAPAAQHCDTVGAHVRAGRATLRHGGCASVRRPCNTATRWVRTCAPAAQRCDTAGAHVCAGRATLRHGGCARARSLRNMTNLCLSRGAHRWPAPARHPEAVRKSRRIALSSRAAGGTKPRSGGDAAGRRRNSRWTTPAETQRLILAPLLIQTQPARNGNESDGIGSEC